MSPITPSKTLTLSEFLVIPVDDVACELIDGKAVPKMSPKLFHASLQKSLLILIDNWCQGSGRVYPEWAVVLKRQGKDWVPVPDLTYVSAERLPLDYREDDACPVLPELVIEIISPGQSFGELAEKATDYLTAGVDRVWIVDAQAKTITVFYPDAVPQTFKGERVIRDELLTGLDLSPKIVFQQAGII